MSPARASWRAFCAALSEAITLGTPMPAPSWIEDLHQEDRERWLREGGHLKLVPRSEEQK